MKLANKQRLKPSKVVLLHPYLETRQNEIICGDYPKQHLWGIDSIQAYNEWTSQNLLSQNLSIPSLLEKFLDNTVFRGSPGTKVELNTLQTATKTEIIYSVCGPLALSTLYPQKLISWVFSLPPNLGRDLKLAHRAYRPKNLRAHAGFMCLTKKAEKYYSKFAPAKFIPWCVDLDMFDGKLSNEIPNKPFFLATGKTGRDYNTLVKAANDTDANIRIIGPQQQKPNTIPNNVTWIDTSRNPPDQAIDYPTLKEWYAQCIGVCIPLSGDADDTCGYTNMLEAMAMRKPVLATKSGCLHIKPEPDGFGMQIKPQDSTGWTVAMNHLLKDHEKALKMGNRGREIVERDFTIERFNQDVLGFIETILNKS
jgi:glycosyltransferase involved in cell wall biosynthesis